MTPSGPLKAIIFSVPLVLGSGVHCEQVTFDVPVSWLICEALHGRMNPRHLMALAQTRAFWSL